MAVAGAEEKQFHGRARAYGLRWQAKRDTALAYLAELTDALSRRTAKPKRRRRCALPAHSMEVRLLTPPARRDKSAARDK